jgi:hypothetical protein
LYSKIKFITERQNYNLRNCRDFDIKFSRYDIKYKGIQYVPGLSLQEEKKNF